MEVVFRTRKLARIFNSTNALRRQYGDRMARTIMTRLAVLREAQTLSMVPTLPTEFGVISFTGTGPDSTPLISRTRIG